MTNDQPTSLRMSPAVKAVRDQIAEVDQRLAELEAELADVNVQAKAYENAPAEAAIASVATILAGTGPDTMRNQEADRLAAKRITLNNNIGVLSAHRHQLVIKNLPAAERQATHARIRQKDVQHVLNALRQAEQEAMRQRARLNDLVGMLIQRDGYSLLVNAEFQGLLK